MNSSTFCERAVHDHDVGGLGGDVAILTEGDADGGGDQSGGVVDAVADEDRGGKSGFGADDVELLLGAFAAVDLVDADQVGQVLHFGLAVAGHQHDPIDGVSRAEVIDEGDAFAAGRVAEAVRGGVAIVDEDDAFESAGRGRELGGCVGLFDGKLFAAGEANLVAADGAAEPLPWLLADLGDFLKCGVLFVAGTDDGFGKRVLGVLLETGDEREDAARIEAGGDELIDKLRLAVGKRAGLIEDHRAAVGDLLEDGGLADDDRALGGE